MSNQPEKLTKEARKHIEKYLRDYKYLKKEIEKLKYEIYHATASVDMTGGGRSNIPGDPVLNKVNVLVSDRNIRFLESVYDAITLAIERTDEIHRTVIYEMYWKKNQTLNLEGIARKLGMGRTTLFRYRDEVLLFIAEQMGWR